MKKIFTLHIFLFILVYGCIGFKKKKNLNIEKGKKSLNVERQNSTPKNPVNKNLGKLGYTIGTIIDKTKTSGCTFVIQINDSTILEPVNLADRFKKEGVTIAFKHRKSRAMTTCLMGHTVVISEVKELKEE